MKIKIGRKIINARRDADMNQEILAQKLGISRTSIVNWENDRFEPTEENLQKLSEVLKKPISYFQEQSEPFENVDTYGVRGPLFGNNTMTLPVLATLPGGLPMYALSDIESYITLPRYLFPGADFIIRCIGKSMEPDIPEGSYCIIRKELHPLNNKIMIVKTDEGFTIKRVIRHNEKYELHPANQNHKIIKPKELIIVGEVIGICRKF